MSACPLICPLICLLIHSKGSPLLAFSCPKYIGICVGDSFTKSLVHKWQPPKHQAHQVRKKYKNEKSNHRNDSRNGESLILNTVSSQLCYLITRTLLLNCLAIRSRCNRDRSKKADNPNRPNPHVRRRDKKFDCTDNEGYPSQSYIRLSNGRDNESKNPPCSRPTVLPVCVERYYCSR